MIKKLFFLMILISIFLMKISAQNCPSYSSTVSSGNTACANQTYYFEVENTNCPGTINFTVDADYGGLFGYEISWDIVSNLTNNVVASGSGSSYGSYTGVVGPISVGAEGQIFTVNVYDSWGDGLDFGGYVDIIQGGTTLVSTTGDFGSIATNIFGPTIDISPATITITTPSGNVTETLQACKDFSTAITLANTNFCNTVSVNLPWEIRCNVTNAVLSSGTKNIIVHPSVPSGAADLVDIDWNVVTCTWDVSPQNDCNNLDIGSLFTISPSISSLSTQACQNTNQNFTIDYLGISGGPSCCSTGGPLVPVSYNTNNSYSDFNPQNSPFGGVNNSAYSQVPSNNTGGSASSVSINVNMTGYSFPLSTNVDNSYWVTVYVDGNPIYDANFNATSTSFNQTFTLADIPTGYDENSILEVYVYPNQLGSSIYVPNAGVLGLDEWTATDISVSISADFTEFEPTPISCSFSIVEAVTCCTPTMVLDISTSSCSGGTGSLSTWTSDVNTNNTTCLVFSSVTPIAGTTLPDNIFPSGINTTCSSVNQIVRAYAYCDANGSGSVNSGDTYTLLSTFSLTVHPVAPTLNQNNGSCGVAPTAVLICNGTTLATRSGIAPIATPCGSGVNTTNLSGTYTAADIGALYGVPASCYSDIAYNMTSSCNQNPIATSIDIKTACETYYWIDGITYTSSNNTATHTIVGGSSFGCDSVVILDLTMFSSDSTFATATSCLPADTGYTTTSHLNYNLCDSTHTIYTSLLVSDSTFATETSCLPADTGYATTSHLNLNLCDSTHTIYTSLLLSDSTFATETSCLPADTGYATIGYLNLNLCDSTHTIYTSLLLSDSTFATETSCLPADTGYETTAHLNLNLCDSTHTIYTSLLLSDSTFATATSCLPADTGYATTAHLNLNLCDSTHTIYTSLLLSDSTFATETSCLPADTGYATIVHLNYNLCDSTHTIYTSLLLSDSTFATETSCLQADTGYATTAHLNYNLCDSTHTIYTSLLLSDSTFATATSCLPADTGYATTAHTNINSCDSTHTIYTSLLLSDSTFATETSCLPADTGYATTAHLNYNLCDSTHTIYTSLLLSDSTFATATSCLPVDTGYATTSHLNFNLCDSTHTIYTSLLASDSTFATETSCLPVDTGYATTSHLNYNLCDSTHTIYTSLLLTDSTFATETSCLPVDTGYATTSHLNYNLCDSTHTIYTSLLLTDSTFATETSCLTADTGYATTAYLNLNLCDSIHTIYTSLLVSDSTYATATSCLPADTGYATTSHLNLNLCDSMHTIYTILLASDSTFATETSCLPADTGYATTAHLNLNLCDSTHTIYTSLLVSDSTFANNTSCNPADVGVVVEDLSNVNNCDSVHIITTTLDLVSTSNESITACDSTILNGVTYVSDIVVKDTITNGSVNGCDSVTVYTIVINNSDSTFANNTSCNPADVGVFVQDLFTVNNCDSVHTITTTLDLVSTSNESITACDSTILNGVTYVSDVIVNDTIANGSVNGCDSVTVYTIVINNSDSTFANNTSCNPLDVGVVVQDLLTVNNCDSVHTITTTLDLVSTSNESITACDSTILNGITYVSDIIVNDTIANGSVNGCDSVTVYTIVINNSDSTFANNTSCNPADVGVVVQDLSNVNNCDSVHTITTTLDLVSTSNESITACDSTVLDGVTYISDIVVNDTITNGSINGCDSVTVYTIVINNSDSTFANITSCNPADVGVFVQDLFTVNNCDSIHTITTTLDLVSTSNESITACDSTILNGVTYVSDIIVNDTITNGSINGCDSVTVYAIVIYNSGSVDNPIDDISRCMSDSSLIYVDYNGSNYVWSNGNIGQYLFPKESGVYTVEFIENGTGCLLSDEVNIELNSCLENCIIAAPTGFSPQASNGANDEFSILTTCEEGFSYFEFSIYNRWGENIFITNNPSEGWNGTYKNADAEIGVYVYNVVYVKNGQSIKETLVGQVTLIR